MRDISFIIPLDPLSLFDVLMNFMGLRVAACQGPPDLTVVILYSTISSKPQSAKQALVPRSLADLCKASTFFVSLRVSTCWMWKKKTLKESIWIQGKPDAYCWAEERRVKLLSGEPDPDQAREGILKQSPLNTLYLCRCYSDKKGLF